MLTEHLGRKHPAILELAGNFANEQGVLGQDQAISVHDGTEGRILTIARKCADRSFARLGDNFAKDLENCRAVPFMVFVVRIGPGPEPSSPATNTKPL